jgi:thiol-disulfide isomerase/thioredoxin
MLKHSFLFLFLISILFLNAQENYKIEIKIKGIEDSTLYLASYFGDKTLLVDTASRKGKNSYVFEKQKQLPGGIYIVVGQAKNSIFEFLIADGQDLKFDSETDNLIEKMKVKGSNENALFYDYLSHSNFLFLQLKKFQQRLKSLAPSSDSVLIYKKRIEALNEENIDYKESIIEAYPDAFISHFFLAMKSPEYPSALKTSDSKADSIRQFNYYKKHYWDFIDFTDDRLIRTPVYHNKLDFYYSSMAHPQPDSLIRDIDSFLSRLPEKSELYKHSLWFLTLKFDQSNRMGYDAILVHFVDTYYSRKKAVWLNAEVEKNLLSEANKRRNSLIGKKAPELIMQNQDMTPVSLYSITKGFTLIYFWDPNCSHCKVETPKLNEFYKQNGKKMDLEVFAVCTDPDLAEMKKYITANKLTWINVNGPRSYTPDFHELYNVYSTPLLFVLDNNRTIIAKQLNVDQLADFLTKYKALSKP